MSKVLIVAEHLHGKLNSSTARCVTCAKQLNPASIDVLVLADAPEAIAADAAKIDGVSKVLTVSNAATNARAVIGPIPGTVVSRLAPGSAATLVSNRSSAPASSSSSTSMSLRNGEHVAFIDADRSSAARRVRKVSARPL